MAKRFALPLFVAGLLACWLWTALQGEALEGSAQAAVTDPVPRVERGYPSALGETGREPLGESGSSVRLLQKDVDANARASLRLRVVAAESGLSVEQVLMHGPRAYGGHPGSELVLDNLVPGFFELSISAPGRLAHRIQVVLEPGRMRDLGIVRLARSLAVSGAVHGPDDRLAKGSLVWLGRFLPEQGVVSWTENRWMRSGPEGRFRFEGIAPGRYLLRCDRLDDPVAAGDFLDMGSRGVWIDVRSQDVDDVRVDLEPLVELRIPGRSAGAQTRSLRIHDESGYELRSEWVLPQPYSVWLVRGRYEVAWWSSERELGRVVLHVRGKRMELDACP